MEKILQVKVKEIFNETSKQKAVERYAEIMKAFPCVNVERDKEFQKKFNGFYRVRRNAEWQKVYYAIMEKGKGADLTFEDTLFAIYKATGRVEASFASKLIHTLRDDMPIWDRFVLQNLGLKMPVCYGEKKIEKAICIYREITAWYKMALETAEIHEKLLEFDDVFPQYKTFSKTKKLDFLLWQMR